LRRSLLDTRNFHNRVIPSQRRDAD